MKQGYVPREESLNGIGGVIAAAITPRRPGGNEIDLGAALDLVEYLSESGVRGIALLGSTGEFCHFDAEDRLHVAALAVKRSRVPVLVNVSHSSLDGALWLAQGAVEADAAGVLLMPPYFFSYDQEEIREYCLQFAKEMGKSIPIFLYNIPFFTTQLASETAAELLATGLFAGIKDSSGRAEYFTALKDLCVKSPFTLLIGNDVMFTRGRSAGAHGVVSGVACAVPELMLTLEEAIQAKAEEKVALLERRLQEFLAWLDRFPAPVGIREAVASRGLNVGPPATPLSAASRRRLDEFRSWFGGWLPAVQKEAERG